MSARPAAIASLFALVLLAGCAFTHREQAQGPTTLDEVYGTSCRTDSDVAAPYLTLSKNPGNNEQVSVTRCAAAIIQSAVDQCVNLTLTNDRLAKTDLLKSVLLITSASAGPITLAAGGSATAFALVTSSSTAGAVLGATLFGTVTTPPQSSVNNMLTAASAYVLLSPHSVLAANGQTRLMIYGPIGSPSFENNDQTYRKLYDAALSQCDPSVVSGP